MKAEKWAANRRLWVEALRDPSRKQITGTLGHRECGGQCCLGVLAEVAGCEYMSYGRWDNRSGLAPRRAVEFVGLKSAKGFYGMSSLATDNDRGKTFAQIADIIESEPPGLFR